MSTQQTSYVVFALTDDSDRLGWLANSSIYIKRPIINQINQCKLESCKEVNDKIIQMLENEAKDVENQNATEDPLTKAIGAIGKWQIWICLVVFLVKFPVAWHQMSIIFLAPPMNFTCSDAGQSKVFDSVCQANCSHYEYDNSVFHETIVSEWDLICDRQWLKNLTQTIFMLGILVGNMMFGYLSDRFGRRIPFLAAVSLQLMSGVATAFSVNWYMFTTLRFFLAVATGGTMVTSFVLTMELIGAKYRDTVGILYQIPFNLGHLTLPLFGYFLRDWSSFQLAISLPSILFLSYYFLLPESPRWLLTAGNTLDTFFTNVAISAAIQVPGTLVSIYANNVLGRKITLISANCVTGLSCLLIIVIPHSGASNLTLGCIGLWGMSISFATVYLYAGELFPTVVRNSGVGLSSTVARLGSMLAPFVATLSHTSPWLPPLAFGIVPLIGAALCVLLPDTRGRKLPDTLEEGEA
ncbi:putative organic cation transporter [Operophtera brumata]|uniref:Putative organic cation transporter n=1 Tax=Operophtera brumata TaxID=104452 RepID=A0A0L7L5U3_OPEBR|nr:putative organic cation transporter [Operophtera brumata]